MQLNDLRVNLTLDNTGFRLSVSDSNRLLHQFEQNLGSTADRVRRSEGVLGSFGETLHRNVQTLGMARFALMDLHDIFLSFPKAVMGSAGEIERLSKLMEGLSTQTDATKRKLEAASNVNFVFNLAKNAPFEVKSLTDTFVKLKTGGIDPTNGSMQALVDSVARFGGSSEELHRASIAIMQMSGKGVISMEELRQQLGEAVPSAMSAMAAGMKMSMGELNKAVSDGTVAAGGAIRKMLAVMSVDNAGAAAEMMGTWTGMLERLKTQWELWKITVVGEGMFAGAKEGLADLIKMMQTPEAESFGREVGRSLADAVVGLVNFTKTVVEMRDELKVAGEVLLAVFAFNKLSPGFNAGGKAVQGYYRTITEGMASVRAGLAAEAEGRRAELVAEAQALEQRIAMNEAEIASEQARANAARAARAQELADAIATNRAILGVYAQRQAANNAAIAAALPSNSPAVAAVARGTATAAQDLEAQVLLRHADAARVSSAEIARRTAALQAENIEMQAERTALMTSTAALTENSAARTVENAALATSANAYRAQAAAITESNAAMAMFSRAGSTVMGAISSMVFSMNGLLIAIMAAAWAWNYFSDKAKQAAEDAKTAFDTKKRLEEGNYNEDTLKANQRYVDNLKGSINATKWNMGVYEQYGKTDSADYKRLKEKLARDQAALDTYQKNLAIEAGKVSEKNGEAAGRALVQGWTDGINKGMSGVQSQVNAINNKYADLKLQQNGKLTDAQQKSQAQELFEARTNALSSAIKQWDAKSAELKKRIAEQNDIIAKGGNAKVIADARQELVRLTTASNLVAEQRANAASSLTSLNAPNEMVDSKKKPKREALDAVQRELASSKVTLDKLETTLAGMDDRVVDIQALRDGVQSHIDALIAGDKEKHVEQKHSPQERAELAALLEQKKLLDLLKQNYGDLAKQRASVTDQFVLANEKMLTGNFNLQPKTKSELQVDVLSSTLEAMKKAGNVAPEVIREYEEKLADAQAVLNGERYVKGVDNYAANKKSIEQLQVGNITFEKQRLAAQQALEMRALQDKYDAQIAAAKGNNDIIKRLQEQFNQESLLLAEKHANEMKTPLEKLADSWRDVTKNMEDATSRWASGAVDAFVQTATTGKLQFGDFAKSVIADLLRIQIQASLASSIKTLTSSFGGWVSGLLGLSTPAAPQVTPHANGGIMTSMGPMPLKKYSMGGIATSPQLALFGEGRMNEAYVPLPDGRTIPVTINGGAGMGAGGAPSVSVNVINQSGTPVDAQAGQLRFDGKGYILDVVMTAASTPGSFRNSLKQALK